MDVLNKYLSTVPSEFHDLVRALDAIVRGASPALSASLKWGNLTYHHTANVCALVAHKNYVNLQVWDGAAIGDPHRLLDGKGKQMRHIKFATGDAPNGQAVAAIVRAAVELTRA